MKVFAIVTINQPIKLSNGNFTSGCVILQCSHYFHYAIILTYIEIILENYNYQKCQYDYSLMYNINEIILLIVRILMSNLKY